MKPYHISIALRVLAIVLLFSALGDHPYGFYTLLRWIVTISSLYTGYLYYQFELRGFAWMFFIIAVLFNPLVPIYMQRETWLIFDILVGIVYLYSLTRKEIVNAT